ncbi:MAG: ribosome small subunit-dependent GTPase A [Dehalococcoidales bacterium]
MAEENEINLEELGWDDYFAGEFQSVKILGAVPGRVVTVEKDSCQALTASGELAAQLSGRMRYLADGGDEYPAVGDWLALRPLPGELKAVIRAILPRKTSFSRQITGGRDRIAGGKTLEQVVAANVDTVFLVSGLDGGRNLNLRRIERYLAIARVSGAFPVIVLNKADLCADIEARIRQVKTIAPGIPVHAVSAIEQTGMDALRMYLTRGNTAALLGSSGVGKSAIVNALLGEERLATAEIRKSDMEGRHTTTRRELILLPGGGAVIDTPGMREIQVWGDEESLDNAFEDISRIAAGCRFADCRHNAEPGCAVRAAIQRGELDARHFMNYQKLQREVRHLNMRQAGHAVLEEKLRWKKISQLQKRIRRDD